MSTRMDKRLDRVSKKVMLTITVFSVLLCFVCIGYSVGLTIENNNIKTNITTNEKIPFEVRKQFLRD